MSRHTFIHAHTPTQVCGWYLVCHCTWAHWGHTSDSHNWKPCQHCSHWVYSYTRGTASLLMRNRVSFQNGSYNSRGETICSIFRQSFFPPFVSPQVKARLTSCYRHFQMVIKPLYSACAARCLDTILFVTLQRTRLRSKKHSYSCKWYLDKNCRLTSIVKPSQTYKH